MVRNRWRESVPDLPTQYANFASGASLSFLRIAILLDLMLKGSVHIASILAFKLHVMILPITNWEVRNVRVPFGVRMGT